MPGVMILEALAQAAGILAFVTAGMYPDEKPCVLLCRHRQGALPAARSCPATSSMLKATLERAIRGIWKFATLAKVDGAGGCLRRQ